MRERGAGADEGGRVIPCATGPSERNKRSLYIIIKSKTHNIVIYIKKNYLSSDKFEIDLYVNFEKL